ncbi:DUF3348 domain-containing protein [Cupriavidus campinensis]
MPQLPRRAAHRGPTLVRLLSRLTDVDAPQSEASLSTQLSQWLGWTDAIALSAALNGNPPPASAGVRAPDGAEARDCARVRAALADAIADDGAPTAKRRGQARPSAQPEQTEAAVDYAAFRHRYLTTQQTMAMEISNLRVRLRKALSASRPEMARLAMVDAVMERVVGAREQNLLANVPTMLEAHFERLRQTDAGAAGAPGAWLTQFRKDMQSVLLAELEIRFEPVEGLLAALRAG